MRTIFDRTAKPVYVRLRTAVTGVLFERRYGLATDDPTMLGALGLEDPERVDYAPAGWLTLRRVLRRGEVGPEDVFVDFGAGKGRVVFLAARYPFKRVIGVELSEELAAVARQNIEGARDRLRCPRVEIVRSDVLDYEIPDDVTVAHFFNPFRGQIFATVIERLLESVDRNPRRLRVIYGNPVEEELLLRTGRFRLVRSARGLRPTAEWSRSNAVRMYECLPSGDREAALP